jgi:tetratricopeptide (TPR) repeat protein
VLLRGSSKNYPFGSRSVPDHLSWLYLPEIKPRLILAPYSMTQLTIQQAYDLAVQHHQAGRLQEAEALYRQILAQQPKHAAALHYFGVLAHQVGRDDVAVDLIRRAIALVPNNDDAHINLGIALRQLGRLDEAIAAYRQAITLRPNHAEAHSNLGNALRDKGELDEAIAAYRRSIALKPNYSEAYSNLGNVLRDTGRLDEAIIEYEHALVLNPQLPDAYTNLGNALAQKGQLDGAIAALSQSLTLNPRSSAAYYSLGNAFSDAARWDEAVAAYRHAIALNADAPEPHNNLAFALLATGNFQQGWQELEWRRQCKNLQLPRRDFAQPQWDGSPLQGRTILLQTEHGFGDSLQFIRYFALVVERGGKIVIQCQPELRRLFQTMAPDCHVAAHGQPLPDFDVHCPLLTLPRIFGTTLANIPSSVPYLHADANEAGKWRTRMSDYSQFVKVGVAWTGNPANPLNRNRCMKLESLAPLCHAPGVRCFSLQKGAAADDAKAAPADMELVDWSDELRDFADTAALIANLDLVISVDTAVIHLAGAMGKPVWTLMHQIPTWRWMSDREDSPWYPTMRLFRQPSYRDWDSVIARVVGELSRWIEKQP